MKPNNIYRGCYLIKAPGILAVILSLGGSAGAAMLSVDDNWSVPADKYVFIERWVNINFSSGHPPILIDFPTYIFDKEKGTLEPFMVSNGKWFPLENLTDLKVVYGSGTGIQGDGAASQIFAITEFPFTDDVVTIEKVEGQGVVYLKRGEEQIVLKPGENWTIRVDSGFPNSTAMESISNYGIFEKSRIKLEITPIPEFPKSSI
ncbi:MAG TPA: hypothetical protein VIO11_08685, partial [Candidatus Methanoperedens sp.]